MNYRYAEQAAEYNTYITKTNSSAERQFGKSVDELLSSDGWTQEEELFVHWYYKKLPVGVSNCTMNKVCSHVEACVKTIKNSWKRKSLDFDYTIYKSDSEYSKQDFREICRLVDDYKAELERCVMMAKRDHLSKEEASLQKEHIIERMIADCGGVCNDWKMLCNLVLDATYGRNKAYQFAWAICGEEIVKNLLELNGRVITYIEANPDGDVEYAGRKYAVRKVRADESYGDCTE